MRAAAGRVYAEMAAAGYGAVGEFHYVHHRPDGTPYEDPNAMAIAVAEAARAAGLLVVLLPAAYHRAGWDGGDLPPTPGQRRFCDPDVEPSSRAWTPCAPGRRGATASRSASPRTASAPCPAGWLEAIAAYADAHGLVRHVHAHEQPRELAECRAEHGVSPVDLLAPHRVPRAADERGPRHPRHAADIGLLAESGTIVVSCPTTEGSLGDGQLPALAYRDAGVRLALGSDSQVRVDPFEETRELETLARREGGTRHALLARSRRPVGGAGRNGRASLGLGDTTGGGHDRGRPRPPGSARAWPTRTCRSRSRRAPRPRSCAARG